MRVALKFGYMETPNVPKALAIARKQGWHFDIMSTSFFLSRRALKPAAHSGMPRWQDRLFIGLAKSASRRHRLLPDSDRPGGRGRHPGHGLSALTSHYAVHKSLVLCCAVAIDCPRQRFFLHGWRCAPRAGACGSAEPGYISAGLRFIAVQQY